ncbi:major facilitator superfamily domain-containing protein [Coniella lustricola]|uniref:Major facilitator superfamily domain-containing protein n=1 Tax=Coniella lustricola TaxID=2025994 RepID=A0A2T2ZUL7_9PEZI|nr:major facilitator superfamily domain-containing protein [Coniella lustricola]
MAAGEDRNASEPGPHTLTSWRLAVVIGSLCLGIFLFGLDTNIIGTAIPRITTEFHSLGDVSWYGSAYLLAVTVIQPLFGNFYKFFNVKKVYLISLLIFEVGSAICAATPSSGILILGRAVLGLGAAGLLQGALAIISNVVSLDQVPMYQGIVVSALGISVCIGPVLGGVLTQYATWRWCFLINIPLGVAVMGIVLLFVPLKQQGEQNTKNMHMTTIEKLRHMDTIGMILFSGAICCLLLVVTLGGNTYPWKSARCIGLFVTFGVLWIGFCFWLWWRGDVALIPLKVLRQRSIWTGALVLFGLGMASQIYAYYFPIFFQASQGVTTTQSGVRFIALVLPEIVAIGIIGWLVTTWGYYYSYLLAGLITASVGAGLLTMINISTGTVVWAAFMVITGIGIGMVQQIPYTAVQAVLDTTDVATGNAIAVFSSQLGGAIALAIAENLLISKLETSIPRYTSVVTAETVISVGASGLATLTDSPTVLHSLREAYSDSVRYTFILAVVGVAISILPACWMERVNIKRISEGRKSASDQKTQEGAGFAIVNNSEWLNV